MRGKLLAALVVLVLFLSAASASAQLADSPWPTFHGNLQRTGLSPYDTSHVDGTLKWKVNLGGGMESSPTIGPDGTVYISSWDGYLYAFGGSPTEEVPEVAEVKEEPKDIETKEEVTPPKSTENIPTNYIIGAFMMLKKKKLF